MNTGYSLAGFARFCSKLVLENGKHMKLEGFQRRMLRDYFAGVRETVILIPKKNGKTSLLAALALYHLLHTEDPNVPVAAASRKQAMILFNQAKGLVQRTKWLQEQVWVLPGYREIRKRDPDFPQDKKKWVGIIDVLAADEDTADGAIPTLACVDELHRHKTAGLYAVLRDGLGARDGQMITISTAGDDLESPLGLLRSAAHAMKGMIHKAAYRYAHSADFAFHEWALEPDDDVNNFSRVKKANPASWQTVAELKRRKTPSTKPWEHGRFACGLWMSGEDSVFTEKEWRACEDSESAIPDGFVGPYIGIDLGWKWDTTAIVPVRVEGEDYFLDDPVVIVPPRDGTSTDDETIKDVLRGMDERWSEITVVLDPEAGGEQLAQWIQNELEWNVVTHSQKATPMALAAQRLAEAIAGQHLHQPGDPELTQHILAAAARPVGEGWKLVKPKRSGAMIDGAVALAMVLSVASRQTEPILAWA